jgi:hypothetical protein
MAAVRNTEREISLHSFIFGNRQTNKRKENWEEENCTPEEAFFLYFGLEVG